MIPMKITHFDLHFVCVVVDSISKKSGKDQESKQSRTTPDPGYHMGK